MTDGPLPAALADAPERAEGPPWTSALHADPRRAVHEDAIVCLECGQAFRQLTNTHLLAHGLTALEYKTRFGYNLGRPLMCHALRRLYADRARRTGLAARIRRRPIVADPELRRLGGARPIMLEDYLTRRDIQRRPRRRWSARDVLAPRPLHRAGPARPGSRLDDDERRVQALRARLVHGRVPDGRHHPDRVRHRLHPARRVQRVP